MGSASTVEYYSTDSRRSRFQTTERRTRMIRYRRSCRLFRAVLGLYMLMCMISTTAFSADTAATAPQPPPGGFGGAGTQPGREGGATPPGPPRMAKVIGLRQVLLQVASRAVELSTMEPTQHWLTKTQQALITPRPATRRTLFASKGLLSFSRTSLSTKHQARQARATPATSMAAMRAFSPWARPT